MLLRVLAFITLGFLVPVQAQNDPAGEVRNDWCRVVFPDGERPIGLRVLGRLAPARLRISDRLGLTVAGPLTIQIVRDRFDMQEVVTRRTGRGPPDWAAGLALPKLDLVLIRADLPDYEMVEPVVIHELTHIALAQAAAGAHARIPRWFEEGVAQWTAGTPRPLDVPNLSPAASFGYLLGLEEINAAFGGGEGAAALAYAQAYDFVRFLARRQGSGSIRQILRSLFEGISLESAVLDATGLRLGAQWSIWVSDLRADKTWVVPIAAEAGFAAIVLAAVIAGGRRLLRRRRDLESRWDQDEPPTADTAPSSDS